VPAAVVVKRVFQSVMVVGAVAGVYFVSRPAAPPPPPSVTRATVSWGAVTETVQATGYLEPLRRINLGSQVSGTVKALYADYNSVVKEGELLAEIDPSLLEVQVAIQQANLERQKNDVANQVVVLEDQQRQYDRTRSLYDRGLATDQQLETAALAVKNREAQLASARTQLVQAQASLSAAELNVSYTQIRSPIDGVVIMRRVNLGQAVQASTSTPTFFMLCTPLQMLKLTAWVDEADIGRVRPGMEVAFQVGTYGSELFTGTVDAIRLNATTSNNVVTYPVWINVPNDALRLRPGMTAQAFIHVSKTSAVARIPNEALRFRPTRALYQALGAAVPTDEPDRAVDHAGDRVVDPTALRSIVIDENADTIDEMFAPLPKADAKATVWTWDQANKKFNSIPVRVGVSDGAMTELLSGEVQVGDELVTGYILPVTPGTNPAVNPLMGNQRRGRNGG
jgi:HlyD family secretion protein